MEMFSKVMGSYDITFLVMVSIIAVLSVYLRSMLIDYQVNKDETIIGASGLKKWRKFNIIYCGLVLLLIVLKIIVFGITIYKGSDKPVISEAIITPPVVKPVTVQTPVLNKEVFYYCMDKAKSKDGIAVDTIKACTTAAQIQLSPEVIVK